MSRDEYARVLVEAPVVTYNDIALWFCNVIGSYSTICNDKSALELHITTPVVAIDYLVWFPVLLEEVEDAAADVLLLLVY